MLNPFKEVNWHPGLAERRKFARSLVVGFPCVAVALLLIGWLSTGTWNFRPALLIGGSGFAMGLVLLALPGCARPFYVVWYAIACSIGLVVGNVLLTVVFYVFVTGIGLVMRALGHRPISKTIDKYAPTYWRTAEQPGDPRGYYRQF